MLPARTPALPVPRVRGRVVFADGAAAPGAHVVLRAGAVERETITNDVGVFESAWSVPPLGVYVEVRVASGALREARFSRSAASSEWDLPDIILERLSALALVLVAEPGAIEVLSRVGIAHLDVSVFRAADPLLGSVPIARRSLPVARRSEAVCHVDGTARLRVHWHAAARGGSPVTWPPFETHCRSFAYEPVEHTLRIEDLLHGRVTSEEIGPVPGARVRVEDTARSKRSVRCNADGWFVSTRLAAEVRARAELGDATGDWVSLDAASTMLALHLPTDGLVRYRIVDPRGSAIREALLHEQPQLEGGTMEREPLPTWSRGIGVAPCRSIRKGTRWFVTTSDGQHPHVFAADVSGRGGIVDVPYAGNRTTGTVRVHLTSACEHPLLRLRLLETSPPGGWPIEYVVRRPAAGEWVIPSLYEGAYEYRLICGSRSESGTLRVTPDTVVRL
jgi:hypothetical protein